MYKLNNHSAPFVTLNLKNRRKQRLAVYENSYTRGNNQCPVSFHKNILMVLKMTFSVNFHDIFLINCLPF